MDYGPIRELRRDSIEVFAGDVVEIAEADADQRAVVSLAVVERWKGDEDTTEQLSWYVGPDDFGCGLSVPVVGDRFILFEQFEGRAEEPIVVLSEPTADWLVCPLGRGDSPSGWHAVNEAEFVRDGDCRGCSHAAGGASIGLSLVTSLMAGEAARAGDVAVDGSPLGDGVDVVVTERLEPYPLALLDDGPGSATARALVLPRRPPQGPYTSVIEGLDENESGAEAVERHWRTLNYCYEPYAKAPWTLGSVTLVVILIEGQASQISVEPDAGDATDGVRECVDRKVRLWDLGVEPGERTDFVVRIVRPLVAP